MILNPYGRCKVCNVWKTKRDCQACGLYNAAVAAQNAAANRIAKDTDPRAVNAWLNEFGVFAWVNGVTVQLAPAYHAAPFAALTREALIAGAK